MTSTHTSVRCSILVFTDIHASTHSGNGICKHNDHTRRYAPTTCTWIQVHMHTFANTHTHSGNLHHHWNGPAYSDGRSTFLVRGMELHLRLTCTHTRRAQSTHRQITKGKSTHIKHQKTTSNHLGLMLALSVTHTRPAYYSAFRNFFSQTLFDFKKSISGPIELKFSGETLYAIL